MLLAAVETLMGGQKVRRFARMMSMARGLQRTDVCCCVQAGEGLCYWSSISLSQPVCLPCNLVGRCRASRRLGTRLHASG